MAKDVQIRAACLLLLLLTSLASGSIFSPQTRQLTDYHSWDTAATKAGLTSEIQRRGRRDTHFPICMFCCDCCRKSKCGICCKT
ncbi:PREDICTED: hepcidin [Elephantulus edwardii]|uniref:hepcidin n=1 Tax=Elephantulus edwardii TaxID=28737 RepID=UPI0003F0E73F|nr:PREDICTED: hepcidin [Elephantulus edwardii]